MGEKVEALVSPLAVEIQKNKCRGKNRFGGDFDLAPNHG